MAPDENNEPSDSGGSSQAETIRTLEEEILVLRRRLQDAPKRVRTLEERLLETKGQLSQAVAQNEKLTYTLREARDHIAALREEVDKLTQPPSAYGTLLGKNDDGTVDVYSGGRKMRVQVHPGLDADDLTRGGEVVLNESLNVVLARTAETNGEVVQLKELMQDRTRAIVVGRADEERVVELSDSLEHEALRAGDSVLMDPRSGLLLERLPRPEVEELVLEEVPDVSYEDVGGLDEQIDQIADAVELPALDFEGVLFERPACAAGGLQFGEQGRQVVTFMRQSADDRHDLSFGTLLDGEPRRLLLRRNAGRRFRRTDALGFQFAAPLASRRTVPFRAFEQSHGP
jgi:proteasome-associated ATPase